MLVVIIDHRIAQRIVVSTENRNKKRKKEKGALRKVPRVAWECRSVRYVGRQSRDSQAMKLIVTDSTAIQNPKQVDKFLTILNIDDDNEVVVLI